jgi:hypothetical protein
LFNACTQKDGTQEVDRQGFRTLIRSPMAIERTKKIDPHLLPEQDKKAITTLEQAETSQIETKTNQSKVYLTVCADF